ncbi:MAG TPA: hypothetical protein VJ625_03325 [Propionibacteriaceae bacterium]|nr:hypothetical protein [Propionibacteriaceae bacterium]
MSYWLAALLRPGDDLDPSLVHRLEPLSLLLGILVWNGADEVMAPCRARSTASSLIMTDRYRRHFVNDLRFDLFKIDSNQPGLDAIGSDLAA